MSELTWEPDPNKLVVCSPRQRTGHEQNSGGGKQEVFEINENSSVQLFCTELWTDTVVDVV